MGNNRSILQRADLRSNAMLGLTEPYTACNDLRKSTNHIKAFNLGQ